MRYEGLLTGEQKDRGYLSMADEDFVFLMRKVKTVPVLIKCFLLKGLTLDEIRAEADRDFEKGG